MKLIGHEILRDLVKRRELRLGDAHPLIQDRYHDHRDYHSLASLISSGYVSTDLQTRVEFEGSGLEHISETLYLMSRGEGTSVYRGYTNVNSANPNDELRLVCTAKADLYFAERQSQCLERIWSVIIGVVIAVVSAAVTAYMMNFLRP